MKLGFHINTPAHEGALDWGTTFEEYLQLIEFAEQLGIDSVWSRQRHFEEGYLSSPLLFFAAASQRARKITFGTALLMFRYWDPILLGEELATLDLLTGGRLEVVYSNSKDHHSAFQDEIFGVTEELATSRFAGNLTRLQAALRGEPLAVLERSTPTLEAGTEIRLQPRSLSLASRIWYGSGSVSSAHEAGLAGIDLFVSTIGPGDVEATQVDQIATYRAALTANRVPRIGVGRYVLPITRSGQSERYRAWEAWFRRDFGRMGIAPIFIGSPDEIVDGLGRSAVCAQADTLLIYLPFGFTFEEYREQLEAIATEVAPQLGWRVDGAAPTLATLGG